MISQIVIAGCGIASIWLTGSPDESARAWAPIFGLVAQPFWMVATYRARQWGIFALSFVYAGGWTRGLFTYWGG